VPTARPQYYMSFLLRRIETSLTLLLSVLRPTYIDYFHSGKVFSNHEISKHHVVRVRAAIAHEGIGGSTPLVLKICTKWV
jgi:acyl-CoA thioesterase